MAKAPKPGAGKRSAEAAAAQAILTITYDDETYALAWQNLPIGERLAVRKATGMPYETFTSSPGEDGTVAIGEDSLCVLLWLARRGSGERGLPFADVADKWDDKKLGDVEVAIHDDGSVDPQA